MRLLPVAALVISVAFSVANGCAADKTETPSGRMSKTLPMIVLDAHEDTLLRLKGSDANLLDLGADSHSDITKWSAGGMNVVLLVAWVDPRQYSGASATDRAMAMLKTLRAQAAQNSDKLLVCETVAECRAAAASGKIAAVPAIEGGIAINDDLANIAKFRAAGVRYMTLAWRGAENWVGAAEAEDNTRGLSEFGKDVVREMNRVGMVIDLSHASDQAFYDVMAVTKRPVIVSHSNAREVANVRRNISDDMIRLLKDNGGVMGINFNQDFLQAHGHGHFPARSIGIAKVIEHIDHVVRIAGIDHVGIGTDYDGGIRPPVGLETAAQMGSLIDALREHGYTDEQVRKIAGENFLRVLEKNERSK